MKNIYIFVITLRGTLSSHLNVAQTHNTITNLDKTSPKHRPFPPNVYLQGRKLIFVVVLQHEVGLDLFYFNHAKDTLKQNIFEEIQEVFWRKSP